MTERNLILEDAVSSFIFKWGDDKTVRSYETRLRQFVRWVHERDDLKSMSGLYRWLIDDYERFLEKHRNVPATVEGRNRANLLRGES